MYLSPRAPKSTRHIRTFFVTALTLTALATFAIPRAHAKPIAFADGWTFMHERDSDMINTDLYYAPTHWFSLGPSISIVRADDDLTRRESSIFHTNFLLKRWNLTHAQGNLFAAVGVGRVKTIHDEIDRRRPGQQRREVRTETTQHVTLQGDYETRQFYSSFKMDAHRAGSFLDRTDTVQLGFSPYAHDYEDLAVWFVGQVKKKRGINNETESGAFVRLFKKNIWVEIGMTERRRSTLMLMINY
jgi:hypothetical protein